MGHVASFTAWNAMETKYEYFIITVSEHCCNIHRHEKLHITNLKS
jgi:hypothetical protein